jgi:muramoyltetrapeptide carboxypeptidase LdcA involved in peptidoglycan recycling
LPKEVLIPTGEEESLLSRTLSQMGSVLPRATAIIMGSFEEQNPPPLNQDLKSKFKNVFYVGFNSLNISASSAFTTFDIGSDWLPVVVGRTKIMASRVRWIWNCGFAAAG